VNAGQTASFEESLGSIANKAQILGYDKTDKKRFDVISEWLKDEENKWLMVLDNADDLNVLLPEETPSSKKKARKDATFQDRPTRDLLDLLPQTTNGSYIVTSRYKQAATRIILGEYQNIIEVPEMTEKEATLLLNKKLVNQAQEDDAQELVSALKCMPLCITQAAAFINEMSPRWTVKRYIEEFRKGDDDRAQLLEQDIYDARRDDKIKRPNSILRTWQISFDHIRRNKPAAARLLSLMSLFDPVAIPDSLLVDRYGEFRLRHRWSRRRKRIGRRPIFTDKKKRSTDCNLEEDLRVLLSFSLIATEADGRHFAMHSLVQFATKQWMEQRDDKDVWMSRYIRVLNDHYPEMDITEDPYETSEQLLKHAYAAFACVPPDRRTIGEWAFLAYKVGYYRERQLYDTCDVQYMYQVALTFLIRAIGWQAPETIRCACRLGKSLKLQSDPRYAEAEDIFRTILKIRKKTLGAAHRDTLAIMDELIHVLNKQGRLVEADALYEKAKSIWIRKYGLHDEGTQNTMRNQIDTLRMRRRYDEAKELAAFAFEGRKRATVEEYDDAWVTDLEHMALSMTMVGKLEKAEAILRDTLQYKEKTLGKTHNMAFKTVRLLATNLWNQGRYQECEELFKRAMQGLDDVANWEKVSVMRQLAWALCEQYKLKEAQELAKTVVEKSIEYLGEEHHETAFALWILGLALKRDKRLDEALEPLEKAYEIALRKQGMDHVDTKDYLQDLASLQEERAQREEEAEIRALCESSQTPDTEGLSATEEGTLASMGVEQLSVFPASAILDPENSGRSAITTEYATARVAICTA
jgi:tetratricopeptide (TPR) repeat protein